MQVGRGDLADDGDSDFDLIVAPEGVPDELRVFVDGLNGLRDLDWSVLGGDLLAECRELVDRVGNAAGSVQTEFVRALDESLVWAERRHRSVKGLLRDATNASPARQARWRSGGSKLAQMPIARDAHAAGLIGADHLKVLRGCLQRRFGDAYANCEHLLVRWAIESDWDTFVNAINTWQETFDLTDPTELDEHADARGLHHSRSFGGLGLLDATLTSEQAEIFDNVLTPIVDELFTADWNDAAERLGKGNVTEADLARTPAQRRVDAFEELCRRAAAWTGGSAKPLTILHVGVDELRRALRLDAGLPTLDLPPGLGVRLTADSPIGALGEHDHQIDCPDCGHTFTTPAGTTSNGDGLPPVTLRHYASGHPATDAELIRGLIDGHIRTFVTDLDGEVLHYNRARRWFTPAQKQAMAARDRECVCGCGLPAHRCHADHRIDWRHHGHSDLTNAQPACPPSHRHKTADPTWTPPDRPHWHRGRNGPQLHRPGRGRRQTTVADNADDPAS